MVSPPPVLILVLIMATILIPILVWMRVTSNGENKRTIKMGQMGNRVIACVCVCTCTWWKCGP